MFENKISTQIQTVCEQKPPGEETVAVIRMTDIALQELQWLWKPYIPFGKVTIIQGNPGEGKTTFALRLAAACTTGTAPPGMESHEPFNILYQTAEDGLGDTIKPRLMEAEADLSRVLVIDESQQKLSLSDKRIEKAIRQNNARLMILDPIQAYLGKEIDMNRANEIRPVFHRLADIAEQTGCAIILVGHLNKACGMQSAYRGLGSIDFRAAARSILLIGRIRKDPTVRVVVHDKSSLAPEGRSFAFGLGSEDGFSWLGGYEYISSDDLLNGFSNTAETKTAKAVELIQSLLSDGMEHYADDIFKVAGEMMISRRTVNEAKKQIEKIISRKVGTKWMWSIALPQK